MGMMHEHQRRDAVTYVHFGCKNLADYNIVKSYIEAVGAIGDTIESKHTWEPSTWTLSCKFRPCVHSLSPKLLSVRQKVCAKSQVRNRKVMRRRSKWAHTQRSSLLVSWVDTWVANVTCHQSQYAITHGFRDLSLSPKSLRTLSQS